jgi:hypothetical protein
LLKALPVFGGISAVSINRPATSGSMRFDDWRRKKRVITFNAKHVGSCGVETAQGDGRIACVRNVGSLYAVEVWELVGQLMSGKYDTSDEVAHKSIEGWRTAGNGNVAAGLLRGMLPFMNLDGSYV